MVPLGLVATSATVADRRVDRAQTAALGEVSTPVDRQAREDGAAVAAPDRAVHSFRAAVE